MRFLAIHVVTSLFKLRIRFLSGMDAVLSIDEISPMFESSVKPASPYAPAYRRFREPTLEVALSQPFMVDAASMLYYTSPYDQTLFIQRSSLK